MCPPGPLRLPLASPNAELEKQGFPCFASGDFSSSPTAPVPAGLQRQDSCASEPVSPIIPLSRDLMDLDTCGDLRTDPLEQALAELAKLRRTHATLVTRIGVLTRTRNVQQSKIRELQGDTNATRAVLEVKSRRLELERAHFTQQLKDVAKERDRAQFMAESLRDRGHSYKRQLDQAQAQLLQLQRRFRALHRECYNAQRRSVPSSESPRSSTSRRAASPPSPSSSALASTASSAACAAAPTASSAASMASPAAPNNSARRPPPYNPPLNTAASSASSAASMAAPAAPNTTARRVPPYNPFINTAASSASSAASMAAPTAPNTTARRAPPYNPPLNTAASSVSSPAPMAAPAAPHTTARRVPPHHPRLTAGAPPASPPAPPPAPPARLPGVLGLLQDYTTRARGRAMSTTTSTNAASVPASASRSSAAVPRTATISPAGPPTPPPYLPFSGSVVQCGSATNAKTTNTITATSTATTTASPLPRSISSTWDLIMSYAAPRSRAAKAAATACHAPASYKPYSALGYCLLAAANTTCKVPYISDMTPYFLVVVR